MEIAIIYMVAGLSSRFGGELKQFAQVGPNGESVMEISMSQAVEAGFSKIIFIVGKKTKYPFIEKFGDTYMGVPIMYAEQSYDESKRNKPWGTTDALVCAREYVDGPFVVCNGDDIYGQDALNKLYTFLSNHKDNATVGYRLWDMLPEHGIVNRGIFSVDQDFVTGITEHLEISRENLSEHLLTPSSVCSMTAFALQPNIMEMLSELLEQFKRKHKDSKDAECFLTTELNMLLKQNKMTLNVLETSSECIGITRPEDVETVRLKLNSKHKPL